jgi:hypothetical protein
MNCSRADPLGNRRQSKVKYIYRLLRHGDIGGSLNNKRVRGCEKAAAAAAGVAPLPPTQAALRRVTWPKLPWIIRLVEAAATFVAGLS